MNRTTKLTINAAIVAIALLFANAGAAQTAGENEELKIAALEALLAAPSEKALPIVAKVMASNNSDEVKTRALFVLSQIDDPQAHQILLDTAQNSDGDLQAEAVRMIGISGDPEIISRLGDVYQSADPELREQILHAYLIAGDEESVYQVAVNATDDEEFETAVNVLGAMGATEQLQRLRDHPGAGESLIHAYAVAGDTESLMIIARDNSDPERQLQAIHGLGIAGGGDETDAAMLDIYRSTDNREVKEAVMHGMMIAGNDQGLLDLFRNSNDSQEKSELLRQLVIMDSDAAMEAIDAALSAEQ